MTATATVAGTTIGDDPLAGMIHRRVGTQLPSGQQDTKMTAFGTKALCGARQARVTERVLDARTMRLNRLEALCTGRETRYIDTLFEVSRVATPMTAAMVTAALEATAAKSKPQGANRFRKGDFVVYPTHGVGRINRVGFEEIAGHPLNLIHISFEDHEMTLRIPVARACAAGLRKLASP